jgi:putative Holliday junction resolvase
VSRSPVRRLAVDPGTVRTGVAVSTGRVAQPLGVLRERGEALVRALADLARRERVSEVVVGDPVRLDGSAGPASERARALATALRETTGLPVILVDERLTTAQAERALVAAGVRRRRRRAVVDGAAACLLLQSYLDALDPLDPEPSRP